MLTIELSYVLIAYRKKLSSTNICKDITKQTTYQARPKIVLSINSIQKKIIVHKYMQKKQYKIDYISSMSQNGQCSDTHIADELSSSVVNSNAYDMQRGHLSHCNQSIWCRPIFLFLRAGGLALSRVNIQKHLRNAITLTRKT